MAKLRYSNKNQNNGYGGGVWLKRSTCKFFEVVEMLYFSDMHGAYIAVYIYQNYFVYTENLCISLYNVKL